MSPAEAQVLLSMCATVDNRKPDADAAKAWAAMLHDLRVEDCIQAVRDHYSESTEWLMPAIVRGRVKKIRSKRLHDAPEPVPPADLTPIETIAWLKEQRRRIANGETVQDGDRGELKPRNLHDLKALMPRPSDDDDNTQPPAHLRGEESASGVADE